MKRVGTNPFDEVVTKGTVVEPIHEHAHVYTRNMQQRVEAKVYYESSYGSGMGGIFKSLYLMKEPH